MTPLELGSKALAVIEKVKKLLALANDGRGNEHQAAAAVAKAQELLEAYNLNMSMLESPTKGTRSDTRFKGGLYKWQRYLMQSIAHLNFCMYWSVKGNYKGAKYEHRVLGREENVIGAEILADYLQSTINRLASETAKEREVNVFCREMIAFREGMAERLCRRLDDLRRDKLEEERVQAKRDEAQDNARQDGSNTRNALVLATLIADEDSLNQDFRWGYEPGTTAQRRRDADAAVASRIAERKQWEIDNPIEFAAEVEADRKANEAYWKNEDRKAKRRKGSYRPRAETAEDKRRNLVEFQEGYDAGEHVSLSQQVGSGDDTSRIA